MGCELVLSISPASSFLHSFKASTFIRRTHPDPTHPIHNTDDRRTAKKTCMRGKREKTVKYSTRYLYTAES